MVMLELAMARPPLDGLALINSVRAAASALGHDGTPIAAHARSARLAAAQGDSACARAHVDAALDTAKHASMVRQYPAEFWLHCGG